MSWMDLDDGILDHPKFIRAMARGGSDTVVLWLGLRSYVAKQLTDGLIPADMLEEVRGPKGAKRAAALLVLKEVGLVEDAPEGLQLHDYLQWSKSRSQVLALREANRQRQAKSRGSHAVTDSVTNGSVTPSVTLPSPHHTTPIQEPPSGVPRARRVRRVPDDWNPKPEHVNLGIQLGIVGATLQSEALKFKDHEFGSAKTDFDAAFRNWLRKSIELRRDVIGSRQRASPDSGLVPSENVPYHRLLR